MKRKSLYSPLFKRGKWKESIEKVNLLLNFGTFS